MDPHKTPDEVLAAWQKIPEALQRLSDDVPSKIGIIAKGAVDEERKQAQRGRRFALKAYRGTKNELSIMTNKGKTIMKGAARLGKVTFDKAAEVTSTTGISGRTVAPKEAMAEVRPTIPVPPPASSPGVAVQYQEDNDWTFFMLASSVLLVAIVSTYTNYDLANGTEMPWNFVLPWLIAAFFLGYSLGYHQKSNELWHVTNEKMTTKTQVVDSVIKSAHFEISTRGHYQPPPPPPKKTSVIQRVFEPVLKEAAILDRLQPWRRHPPVAQVDVNNPVMGISGITMDNLEEGESAPFLRIPMPVSRVTMLDEYTSTLPYPRCVENLGMDLFFNGGEPLSNVSNHPVMLATLRQKAPMIVINGMTHIANVLLYFRLPDWVTSWKVLQEISSTNDPKIGNTTTDNSEAAILRDFLLGDDTYRDERLKVVPQIVDAPLPVKLLAPAKAEILVKSQSVPSCWYKSEDSQDCFPALELELDMIASSAIRSIVGIVSRHLHRISCDIACLIYDKEKTKSVCLTCFCFDHVDMTSCPSFPEAKNYAMDYAMDSSVNENVEMENTSTAQAVEVVA